MDSQGLCAVCLGSLNSGAGQALFTAECSHKFHYNCIAYNLQHGSHNCPTCHARWTQQPFQVPSSPNFVHPTPLYNHPFSFGGLPISSSVDPNFDDDEPLPSPTTSPASSTQAPPAPRQGGGMTVKTLPEYPALPKSEQSDSFPVLVGIRAPPLSMEASDRANQRAPIDLVAVLDVSGSMYGDKIRLLKQAVNFVINNLGPTDRLSIITYSTYAKRITPLRRMTETGRADTVRAVGSVRAEGSTNIIAGLQTAVRVLEKRRQKNPVASVILLSDGHDTNNFNFISCLNRLPNSIRSNAKEITERPAQIEAISVHSFGFGSDHDAKALHAIADGAGGTFSYIEAIEVIQDAFAQCIGGLLSVVAQEVEILVHSCSPDVHIRSIASGRYRTTVDSVASQHGVIYIGDIYAEEEKQFLVYLSVPQALASASSEEGPNTSTTKLLNAKCSYKDLLSNEKIMSDSVTAEIRRPAAEALSEEDKRMCLEVDRERNRVAIGEGIARAQEMAERGEMQQAQELLGSRRMGVLQSFAGQAGDAPSMALFGQAGLVQQCMVSKHAFNFGGNAFALSTANSHMYQRASTRALNQSNKVEAAEPGGLGSAAGFHSSITFGSAAGFHSSTTFGSSAPFVFGLSATPAGNMCSSRFGSSAGPVGCPSSSAFGSVTFGSATSSSTFGASAGTADYNSSSAFGSFASGDATSTPGFGYQTSIMRQMVEKSQQERQSISQVQPPIESSNANSFSFSNLIGN